MIWLELLNGRPYLKVTRLNAHLTLIIFTNLYVTRAAQLGYKSDYILARY